MQAAQQQFGDDTPLPALRPDLTTSEAGYDATGAAGVILYDPLRHRFFRLPQNAGRMLQHWALGKAGGVAQAARVSLEDVQEFIGFLSQSRLTLVASGGVAALQQEYQYGEKSYAEQALHNYLFFRLPLFNPTPFLDYTLPIARALAGRFALWVIGLIGLVGLYFAARQWDSFVSTFFDFFSLEGLALYSTTLVGLKIFHELGHGYMARHFKVRVPVMGIAFMLLAPMLYTETTDAWRLKDRKQRLLIDAAGVMVEIAIAMIALFLWAFLPDGPWRSACYFVAATAWIMSLVVNLSPFMRFDGYHILADALGMYNLGPRAFALGTWKLRQILFAPIEAPPEQFSVRLKQGLIVFAWGTWIYRLSLYLGIAYTVYKMFPKAVGIPMGLIELWFFTAAPIMRELKEWKAMGFRHLISTKRSYVTLGLCGLLLLVAALPLNRNVSVPAVLLPAHDMWLYPPEPAQIERVFVSVGQAVRKGDMVAQLSSLDFEQKWRMATLRYSVVEAKLAHIAADRKDLAALQILKQERQAVVDEINGLRQRSSKFEVRAPFDGMVSEVAAGLDRGMWVGRDSLLLHIVDPALAIVAGLANESDSARLQPGSAGRFVAESGGLASVGVKLVAIGSPGGEGVEMNYLSSLHGGPVAMAQVPGQGRAMPVSGILPLKFSAEGAAPQYATRGTLTVAAQPVSFLSLSFGRVVSVFLRESGF
jgi:putative peptide zinc metalloprotease protein